MLDKLGLRDWPDTAVESAQCVNRVLVLVRMEPRGLVELENVTVKIVRSGAGDEGHLRARRAPVVGGEVARDDLELRDRIRVRTERREVRSARARVVNVYPVEREVKGAIARAMDVDAATGVGAHHDTGLKVDEAERVASAAADDGKCFE